MRTKVFGSSLKATQKLCYWSALIYYPLANQRWHRAHQSHSRNFRANQHRAPICARASDVRTKRGRGGQRDPRQASLDMLSLPFPVRRSTLIECYFAHLLKTSALHYRKHALAVPPSIHVSAAAGRVSTSTRVNMESTREVGPSADAILHRGDQLIQILSSLLTSINIIRRLAHTAHCLRHFSSNPSSPVSSVSPLPAAD